MSSEFAVSAPPEPTLVSRDIPRRRRGYRLDVDIAGTAFGVTANVAGNRLVEVDIEHAGQGSFGHGMSSAVALLTSAALQHGMSIEEFVETFRGVRFEPFGLTDDPEIRRVSSPMDYLARRFGKDFLSFERQRALGLNLA